MTETAVDALKRYQNAISAVLSSGGRFQDESGKPFDWWDKIVEAQQHGAMTIRAIEAGANEAATALASAEAQIAELTEALQAAADEFDGTISGAERARGIARTAIARARTARARSLEKQDG